MKFKFWKIAEMDFDKDDAKFIIPLFLIILSLIYCKSVNPIIIVIIACIYYLLYFSLSKIKEAIKFLKNKIFCTKCPKCRSKDIILQGYETYRSDEYYPYYLCLQCESTSIDAINGLIVTHDPEKVKQAKSDISKPKADFNEDISF